MSLYDLFDLFARLFTALPPARREHVKLLVTTAINEGVAEARRRRLAQVAPEASAVTADRLHDWPDPDRPEEWSDIDEECAFCSVRARLRWVDERLSRRHVVEVSRDGLTWTPGTLPARCGD